jgi:ERCC4-related helicase
MSSYNKESFVILGEKIKTIVIPSMFPSLITKQQEILSDCVFRVIITIIICFNYNETNFHQFEQNNYQDIKWITYLLLPYLNEEHNKLITNFDDIYISKKRDCDINLQEPNYIHSNIQYNLFNRRPNEYSERHFTTEMLYQNYYLLLNTIKTMSNKMHVNWMDILPYTLNDYKKSMLYKNTEGKISHNLMSDWNPINELSPEIKIDDLLSTGYTKMTGLQMVDIYNTMSIYLYEEIIKIKWLIFDIVGDTNIYPQIFVLNDIFDLTDNIGNVSWDELTFEKKTNFTNRWKILLEEAQKGNDLKLNLTNLSNDSLKSLLRSMIVFFNYGSLYVKEAKKEGYVEIIKEYDEDDEEEKIPYSSVVDSLESVQPKYMYEYISDSIETFKNTWYGTKILNPSKTQLQFPFKHPTMVSSENGYDMPITFKNIYNFAKSFVNRVYLDKNDKSKIARYSLYWDSLKPDEKAEIINRINGVYDKDDNYYQWFNIKRYIRKLRLPEYAGLDSNSKENVVKVHNVIYHNLRSNWTTLIFEPLIMKGILTEFKPCPEKTDQNFIIRDNIYTLQGNVFDTNDTNPYWKSAYHYLTMKPYYETGNFKTADFPSEGIAYNYFTLAKNKKYQWYTAYSYDWIAQIGFCHHFLNNRVIYITGATGVGKSTEIPKLFLYYSKALDYLLAPKVVCTQPRKAPTENNAGFVSTTLGIPIFEYDEKGTSRDTNNYFIQMKHRDREHTTSKRANHPVLEYATDGSLILQINDVLGKVIRKEKYTTENTYDIIMIDEAHEHKINMDLLLTYLKTNIAYNNQMKLVILSATMEEDEPKYRRFYRDINDNRKYPLNTWIVDNNLDRICIDRRFHISPPGMGTKYEVKDFYEPTETEIGMVERILKSSSEGDILIFQPGTNDITKLVTALNEITPPNVIAIPYHSQLSSDKREFVEKISEKRVLLKISKQDDFASVSSLSNGSNSYSRIIIIATNVAEASITIPSLKFVIETGTQKVQLYDYIKRGEKLVKTFISESSRVQRRGRVGRKASGTVYYLYEKGKMSQNKIICEISTSNIALQLFGKLRENVNEQQFILPKHDPNKYQNVISIDDLENYSQNNLSKILKSQYFIGTSYFEYFGNNSIYDYENCQNMAQYYQTGFDSDTLYDKSGKFYIVHPDESFIQRNINGDIIGKKDETDDSITLNNRIITSKKIDSFWKTLVDYMYIQTENNQIIKTIFGKNIIELFEKLKLEDHSMFRSLIFGLVIGCGEDILRLYVLYQILQYNPQNIFKVNENNKPVVNDTIYSEKSNDSLALLEIINNLHQYLNEINVSTKADVRKYMNYFLENTTYNYTREDYAELLGPEDQYSESLRKKIISTSTKKIYKELHDAIKYVFDIEITENKRGIAEWCTRRQLDYNKIVEYMQTYIKIRTDINKNMSDENRQFISDLRSKLRINELHSDKITLSLLFGYPFNVCRKIKESSYYMSSYIPSLNNMYQIGSSSMYKFRPVMLMRIEFIQEYLLYLAINIENNTITCLHKITPEILMLLDNIYSRQHYEKIKLEYDYSKDKLSLDTKTIIQNNTNTVSLQNAILYSTHTIDTYIKEFPDIRVLRFKTSDLLR